MKITAILFGFSLCLSILTASGQNVDSVAIRRYYAENSILWLGRYKYEKNNQLYPVSRLKIEFAPYRDASTEYNQYLKTNRAVAGVFLLSSALIITSFVAKDRNVKIGCAVGSLVAVTVAIPLSYKGIRQLTRSIWYYNRDILLK